MGLTKYKLGELIEANDERNEALEYGIDNLRGISTQKIFIETKADMIGVPLKSYKIVKPYCFAYVSDTSRRGDKISLAYNTLNIPVIVSSISTVFHVKNTDLLLSDYLFMYFNRPEFDRYSRFNSWGSARETFDYGTMSDMEIEIPHIDIQQQYVDVYNAMLANQQNYERGLDDLMLQFEILIDKYKHIAPKRKVVSILQEADCRNITEAITEVQGININKEFMPSIANTNGVNLSKYKIVKKGQFAFSGMQTGRDECIRIALYNQEHPIIISPAYSVLNNISDDVISEYIMLWFSRKEIDRLGCFMSDASIRTNLDMDRFNEITIPVPDIDIQQDIVNIYKVYKERKRINERLKAQIKDICPILIKGSLEEARKKE